MRGWHRIPPHLYQSRQTRSRQLPQLSLRAPRFREGQVDAADVYFFERGQDHIIFDFYCLLRDH